jgi:DNA polymerase-3 subunit epsilon
MTMTDRTGITHRGIQDTPIAVVDMETTGLTAGVDRVVEITVIRREPNSGAQLVLDTLINPGRPIAATEIHGITDSDVRDAPAFKQVAAEIVDALSDCAVASYNVYFDIRFLQYELSQSGIGHCPPCPPHFCLMYLRPMLRLGPKCSLPEACRFHGIDHSTHHIASADADAAARLLEICLAELQKQGLKTFQDLRGLKKYKFLESFGADPLQTTMAAGLCRGVPLKSRKEQAVPAARDASQDVLVTYWDALTTIIADFEVTDDEVAYLEERRQGLVPEQVRVLHARAFTAAISQFVNDKWLESDEREKLRRLYRCLSRLGWAPGE